MSLVIVRALRALAPLVCAAALAVMHTAGAAAPASQPHSYLPLVLAPGVSLPAAPPAPAPPPALPTDWLSRVNHYRALAGVPPVSDDARLSASCRFHAAALAGAPPPPGQEAEPCAQSGGTWVGESGAHTPLDSLEAWMDSPEQRQWLLYPTTPAFGYGFSSGPAREAAALDARTAADDAIDASFSGWPVRYPGVDQIGVSPDRSPVTLLWRRGGPAPHVAATLFRTADGTPIPHSVDMLPGGHQGVQIVPLNDLPERTVLFVEVSGTYGGVPFSAGWQFATGERSAPYHPPAADVPDDAAASAAASS